MSFTVRPRTRTAYRLAFAGTGTFRPAKSAVVHVGIRAGAQSSLSIRGRDVAKGFAVSGQLRAQGHAGPERGGDAADADDADDLDVDGHRHGPHGRNGFVRFVRPSAPGTQYRLAYVGTRFAASTSATLTD